jgi:hypothetical protein
MSHSFGKVLVDAIPVQAKLKPGRQFGYFDLVAVATQTKYTHLTDSSARADHSEGFDSSPSGWFK